MSLRRMMIDSLSILNSRCHNLASKVSTSRHPFDAKKIKVFRSRSSLRLQVTVMSQTSVKQCAIPARRLRPPQLLHPDNSWSPVAHVRGLSCHSKLTYVLRLVFFGCLAFRKETADSVFLFLQQEPSLGLSTATMLSGFSSNLYYTVKLS